MHINKGVWKVLLAQHTHLLAHIGVTATAAALYIINKNVLYVQKCVGVGVSSILYTISIWKAAKLCLPRFSWVFHSCVCGCVCVCASDAFSISFNDTQHVASSHVACWQMYQRHSHGTSGVRDQQGGSSNAW